jgi:hypothetical protein
MRKTTPKARIRHTLVLTASALVVGVLAAPPALADPGDVGDASLWRTSPTCHQPKDIVLYAQGAGVLEFEYRVIGAEPTTHKIRPTQEIAPRLVKAAIAEDNRPIRWRVVAYDTDLPDFVDRGGDIFPLDSTAAPSSAVKAFCGNDAVGEVGRGEDT